MSPLGGLRPFWSKNFSKPLGRLTRTARRTILLIEQNAKKALQIASKGYVLQKGEIVVKGSRKDLYENGVIRKAYLRG
jgi:branched-chain amino acid transport system ATP-binding protein